MQMRLSIARKDFTRTSILSKKISTRFFQQEDQHDIKLTYYKYLILLARHHNNYLELCKHHRAVFDTPRIQADTQVPGLEGGGGGCGGGGGGGEEKEEEEEEEEDKRAKNAYITCAQPPSFLSVSLSLSLSLSLCLSLSCIFILALASLFLSSLLFFSPSKTSNPGGADDAARHGAVPGTGAV